jgi:hypothetical protein
VLKVSTKPWYFSVDDWSFNRLKSTNEESLLKSEAQAALEESKLKKTQSQGKSEPGKTIEPAKQK